MKINHNMAAVISNAQLLRTENGLAASVERLSSGLKINHAKDDPAGMAISNKMKAQIDGLGKASDNASNGVSVLQIADSALGEITSMLQRMRELSVQAATDTNKLEDRQAIQQEISSLREEVDRISRDTEYNTKKLLDGTSDTRVYADGVTRMAISDAVQTNMYKMTINTAATQSAAVTAISTGTSPEGAITINGVEITISEGEEAAGLFEKLRQGAELADVSLIVVDAGANQDYEAFPSTGGYEPLDRAFELGDSIAFVSNQYGYSSAIEISCSNNDLASFLGLDGIINTPGEDADVELDLTSRVALRQRYPKTATGTR